MKITIERVGIYIHATNQHTTAQMDLNPIHMSDYVVATLSHIPCLKPFQGFTKVTVKIEGEEIEAEFYYGDAVNGNLTQRNAVRLNFWIKQKESEEAKMKHKVTITKTEQKTLEEYWCMRAIKLKALSDVKTVIKEKECEKEPTLEEIATFLTESGGDFVSVAHNYRFENELPFD